MKHLNFKSIKTKLVLLITIVITLISLFVFLYFPTRFEQQQVNSIAKRVESLAQIASYSVASALFFNDEDVTKEQIDALVLSEDIEYVVIRTPKDTAYFQYNYTLAINAKYLELNVQAMSEDKTVYRTKKNIELNNTLLGTLYLGYSLKEMNNEISGLKSNIAWVSIVIFILSLVAVYNIGSFTTRPITSIVQTVEEIRNGDLTKRAQIKSVDEIGFLAKSFNGMVDRIQESNEELETINKELEQRVEERTHELSKSEERFRGLYENASIGIYRTTEQGEILLANPALVKMLGYSSFDDLLLTKNVSAGYENPKDREDFLSKIKHDGIIVGQEQKWAKKDGEIIYVSESARIYKDSSGNIIHIDGTVEDITAKKIIEDELISAKEKAEAAVRMKTDFLAQMSHEIRTPINSIMSYTQLLKDETINLIPEDLRFSFDMINNGGRRLIRTIDLILNVSEMQTGTYEPIVENCDIVDVISNLVGEFQTTASSKNLDLFMLNRLDEHENKLMADIYTITQIFANLIHNAIKYTSEGSIEVVIYKTKDETIAVDVQDTGIGISNQFQRELFDAFSQEEQGYTRKFEGNGLGMALVKEYCKLNNAIISVKSEKDKGSTFTVEFPIQNVHSKVSKKRTIISD